MLNRWELLTWAAITTAHAWCHMQLPSAAPSDASRYRELVERVRTLIPFVETSAAASGAERWNFLAMRHLAVERHEDGMEASTDLSASSPSSAGAVLLLRTCCGFDLWGNLDGLELRDRIPSLTALLPTRLPSPSTRTSSAHLDELPHAFQHLPEELPRATLTLVWEWFLLEIAGAAPPATLWATIQEPIAPLARPRIRAALASLRQHHQRGPTHDQQGRRLSDGTGAYEAALLDRVLEHTQIERLLDEMDAADEAREAAAAREAEARRRAAETRRRLEVEARRQAERRRESDRLHAEREHDRRMARQHEDEHGDARGGAHAPPQPPPEHERRERGAREASRRSRRRSRRSSRRSRASRALSLHRARTHRRHGDQHRHGDPHRRAGRAGGGTAPVPQRRTRRGARRARAAAHGALRWASRRSPGWCPGWSRRGRASFQCRPDGRGAAGAGGRRRA